MADSEQTKVEVTKLGEPNQDEVEEKPENVKKDLQEKKKKNKKISTYKYDKKHLYELAKQPFCKKRPGCLSSEHINSTGVWDPEKWFRASHGDSPDIDDSHPKKLSEYDGKAEPKKRFADPKERLKDELRDDIILSPQRRSFGTGCHVTQHRLGSPADTHDSHKESIIPSRDTSHRRIGSGRLMNRSNIERQDSDRDYGYKPPMHRDRDFINNRYKDRDFDRNKRSNRHRMAVQEEPEWYSDGPTSQLEFIELRGFEENPEQSKSKEAETKPEPIKKASVTAANQYNQPKESNVEKDEYGHQQLSNDDSRQPEDVATSNSHQFDVNEFFKLDSIPGLSLGGEGRSSPNPNDQGLNGSRFSQWQNASANADSWPSSFRVSETDANRQNSISSIINDVDGVSQFTNRSSKPERNILEILQNANINVEPHLLNNLLLHNENLKMQAIEGKARSVEELEAGLVHRKHENHQRSNQGPPNFNHSNNNRHRVENNEHNFHNESSINKFLHSVANMEQSARPAMPHVDKSRALSEVQLLQDMFKQAQSQKINDVNTMMANNYERDTLNKILHYQHQAHLNETMAGINKQQEQNRRVTPPQDILAAVREHNSYPPGLGNDQEMHQPQIQSGIQQREMLMSLMKQQQLPQSSASPIMGHPLLVPNVGRISPVTHSPLLPENYQQSQRVPSPLLFSQQPPMISHAPSPIHPGQGMQSATSQNSLQIHSSNTPIPRVPSPQELIVRTQAIYHNALIQKKVEEQRGNFRKKQEQHRPTSPISMRNMTPPKKTDSQSRVTIATFTPTQVMRKMHTDSKTGSDSKTSASRQDIPNSVGGSPVRNAQARPLVGQGVMNSKAMMQSQGGHIPTIAVQGEGSPPRPLTKANNSSPRIIVANSLHHEHQNNGEHVSSAMFRNQVPHGNIGSQVRGGMPPPMMLPQSNMQIQGQQQQHQQSAELMFRNMLAQQQAPKYQGQSVGFGHQPPQPQNSFNPAAFNPRKMPPPTGNAQSLQHLFQNQMMAPHPNVGMNGPAQALNVAQHNEAMQHFNRTSGSSSVGGGNSNPSNLSKWFGTEILKHNLPTMPPVPTKKALSLEEVERQQQVA